MFIRSVLVFLSLLVIGSVPAANAGTVVVANGEEPHAIVLEARDATIAEILAKLGERFAIDVEGAKADAGSATRSGRWQGSLRQVLARVLRKENHIVSGSAMSGGRLRVVLLPSTPSIASGPRTPTRETSQLVASSPNSLPTTHPIAPDGKQMKQAIGGPIDDPTLLAGLEIVGDHARVLARQFGHETSEAEPATPQAPSNTQALTQQVSSRVQTLALSLQSICIGGCGRGGK